MNSTVLAVLLLILLVAAVQAEKKLLKVEIVSRHCDRNTINDPSGPYAYIPADKIDFNARLGVERGKLTNLGVGQCVLLGKKIRERYVEPTSDNYVQNLEPIYNSTQYAFVSTDLDRTLRSMWSVSQGIFPPGPAGPKVDVDVGDLYKGNFSLPYGATSIPIQSVKGDDDIRLRAYAARKCSRIRDRLNVFRHSTEYQKIIKRNENTIEQAQQWADMEELDFDMFHAFYDLMVVQKSHGLLTSPLLNQNFNQLQEIAYESNYALYRNEVLGVYGGGVFLHDVLADFNQQVGNGTKGVLYQHHSAHDSTIMAIIVALELDTKHPELRNLPNYGAALAFELWQDDETQEAFVRISYSNHYSNPTWTNYEFGENCDKDNFCSLNKVTITGISPGQWCNDCVNIQAKECLVQDYQRTRSINIAFAISAPLLTIIIILLTMTSFIFGILFYLNKKGYQLKIPGPSKSSDNLIKRQNSYEEF